MNLDLNEEGQGEKYRSFHNSFNETYVGQMPRLVSGKNYIGTVVADGREPVSIAQIFERRLNSSQPNWMGRSFDSVTAFVIPEAGLYDDGRFKVVRRSDRLRDVSRSTQLFDGAIPVDYEQIQGKEFRRGEVLLNRNQTVEEARENLVLLELFDGDKALRDAAVEMIYREAKMRFRYHTMLGLFLPQEGGRSLERPIYVLNLKKKSSFNGKSRMDLGYTNLVGMTLASRPQVAQPA